jgi:hypothetical protein
MCRQRRASKCTAVAYLASLPSPLPAAHVTRISKEAGFRSLAQSATASPPACAPPPIAILDSLRRTLSCLRDANRVAGCECRQSPGAFVRPRRPDLVYAVAIDNREASESGVERKGGGRCQGRSGVAGAPLPLMASHALARICPDPLRPAIITLRCGACSAVLSLDRCSSVHRRAGSLMGCDVLLAWIGSYAVDPRWILEWRSCRFRISPTGCGELFGIAPRDSLQAD